MTVNLIRLNKYCSEQGIASRRQADAYIKKGWIMVNGQVIQECGQKIDPNKDIVKLCSEALQIQAQANYIVLYKPSGYVSNLPQLGEKTASELLPVNWRRKVHVVGRLDKDSEGLLFFTDDGRVANRLKSPEFSIEKIYEVVSDRPLIKKTIDDFQKGILLQGNQLRPIKVQTLGRSHYLFTLTEGKNRQIRRMLKKYGYLTLKIKRLKLGPIALDRLAPGEWRELSISEAISLKRYLNLD